MSTSKDYLNFLLEQLSSLDEITWRMMMGEYLIYYRGKVAAYVCDNRFLVKPVPSLFGCFPMRNTMPSARGTKRNYCG